MILNILQMPDLLSIIVKAERLNSCWFLFPSLKYRALPESVVISGFRIILSLAFHPSFCKKPPRESPWKVLSYYSVSQRQRPTLGEGTVEARRAALLSHAHYFLSFILGVSWPKAFFREYGLGPASTWRRGPWRFRGQFYKPVCCAIPRADVNVRQICQWSQFG